MKLKTLSILSIAAALVCMPACSEAQTAAPKLTYTAVFSAGSPAIGLGTYELWELPKPVLGGRLFAGPAIGTTLNAGLPAYGAMAGIVWDVPTKLGPTFSVGGAAYVLFSGTGQRSYGLGVIAGVKF